MQSYSLLQLVASHVATEYWSICKDIEYWRRVADVGVWEAYYITYFNQGPVKLYQHFISLLFRGDEVDYTNEAHQNIAAMRLSLIKLSRMLTTIAAVADEFKTLLNKAGSSGSLPALSEERPIEASVAKRISQRLGNLLRGSFSTAPISTLHHLPPFSSPSQSPRRISQRLLPDSKLTTPEPRMTHAQNSLDDLPGRSFLDETNQCFHLLQRLCDVIFNHNDNFHDRLEDIWTSSPTADLKLPEMTAKLEIIYTLFANNYRAKPIGYPLALNQQNYRRPSYLNQYWISYSLLGLSFAGLLRYLGPSLYSGELQFQCIQTFASLRMKLRDYVIEPVYELIERIFITIRHRELVVSREELIQSHQALTRMLSDYAAKYKTPDNVQIDQTAAVFDAHDNYDYSKGDIKKVMDALMVRYEHESKNPIQGFLFGSLMTSMLIQMQVIPYTPIHWSGPPYY